jgi:hypothetical protein
MTWGSNASCDRVPCPHCGESMIDDADQWPTSHMKECLAHEGVMARLRRLFWKDQTP